MCELFKRPNITAQGLCPFCGGVGENRTVKNGEGAIRHYIRCRNCGAMSRPQRYLSDTVMCWDKRVNLQKREGFWQIKANDGDQYSIVCSECGKQYIFTEGEDLSKHCGECGTRLLQCKQIGSRKIPVEDQMEAARRIYESKRIEARKKELEIYRKQEKAEEILQNQINSSEETEKQS